MSDTEEVVITRTKAEAKPPKNTKPEIAREKLKEKRERLKKEKENMIIEEAKKRMISESEKKLQEEALAKQQEEEKKKSDPTYIMMQKMEQMMSMFNKSAPAPIVEQPVPKKRATKKVVIPEPEPEPEVEEKPKRKPRVVKEVVSVNKSPGLPKPRKKVVYLQQEPIQEESTQFVGYDVAPPAEPIQYHSSSGLLSAMMGRRNMSSYYE